MDIDGALRMATAPVSSVVWSGNPPVLDNHQAHSSLAVLQSLKGMAKPPN